MRVLAEFYDRLYYGLVVTFSKAERRTYQIASAATSIAMFESWYWFDANYALYQFEGRLTSILSLRLKLIFVFVVLSVANTIYFYSRHDRIARRLDGDRQPSIFDMDALVFYAGPIVISFFLLSLGRKVIAPG